MTNLRLQNLRFSKIERVSRQQFGFDESNRKFPK